MLLKKVSSTPHRLSTAARFFSGISNIQFSAQLISRNKKNWNYCEWAMRIPQKNLTGSDSWCNAIGGSKRDRGGQIIRRRFISKNPKSRSHNLETHTHRAARDFFIFQFGFPSAAVCCLHSRKLTFENLDQLIRINYRWVPQMVNDWVSTVFFSLFLLFGMINRVQQQLNWFSESRSGWGLLYACSVFSDPSDRAKANHWEKIAGENIIYWMKLTLQSRNEHLPN